jgi:filamentous hemagglutinin family protein
MKAKHTSASIAPRMETRAADIFENSGESAFGGLGERAVIPGSRQTRLHRNPRCLFRLSAALGVCFTLAATLTTQARDLLRPGSGPAAGSQGSSAGSVAAAETAQARANALDILTRTSQAIQSVQAMQNAARNLAGSGPNNLGKNPNNPAQQLPNVPNGLNLGGLQVAAGATAGSKLWQGANLPTQTTSGGNTVVNVQQTSQQAVLNWSSFSVGKNTTLNFNQSAGGANVGQWVAFNKINDPSGVPSQILGSITAQGQVYVINQNGIIFGGSSQVNVHTLVASSLPINDNLINNGVLNNPDSQFLFTSLPQAAGSNGTPAFTPPAAPNGKSGDVTVQAGATLSSPTTADHVGGRIALFGPNVTNSGTISTPDGQTILAAGQQVGLAAHSSQDPTLRGLDVYVGAVTSTSGTVTNTGIIDSARADVTMAGKSVNQLGIINSSTSVAYNGRIDLLANYGAVANPNYNAAQASSTPFIFASTGAITLGPGSVSQIVPELSSTDTVVGTSLALPSTINMQGKTIYAASNSVIWAPNASVTLSAGLWNFSGGSSPTSLFAYSGGQIYLDQGAIINVAGSVDVSVPISQNIITVQLRGTELADDLAQRNGVLRGQTVVVDVGITGTYDGVNWIGTPIANLSGYANLIQRTVGELTIAGGTVALNAGGSVVMQKGSSINVSGGWIDYQGGMVQTTRVVSGGHVYDISQVTPDMVIQGLYTGTFTSSHPKWNLDLTYNNPLGLNGAHYENGYLQGGDGGGIFITAPAMALDGTVLGNTVAGERQLRNFSGLSDLPATSTLSLSFLTQDATTQNFYSSTPPNIIIADGGVQAPAAPFAVDSTGSPLPLSADRQNRVFLSPSIISANGFGNVTIDNSDGNISIPASTSISAPALASITLKAANIDIAGTVTSPGGSLQFLVYDITPHPEVSVDPNLPPPLLNPSRGLFTLGSSGVLNVAGSVVDDRVNAPGAGQAPITIAGGAASVTAYSVVLSAGSTVNASGGASVSAKGTITYGNGGSIAINGGQDIGFSSIFGGSVQLNGTLQAFSGATAGSLSIKAPLIQIGGTANTANTLLLQPSFFDQGGFGSFTLTGLGAPTSQTDQYVPGVYVAPGTLLDPVAQSWILTPNPIPGLGLAFAEVLKPAGQRTPVSLTLNDPGVRDPSKPIGLAVRGAVVIGQGAVILTDPLGSVSITGDTVTINGSVIVPGGSINVASQSSSFIFPNGTGGVPVPTLDLGPSSLLSTAGTTILTPNARGYRTGTVVNGGSITVSGNIVAQAGATIDVSGSSDVLSFAPNYTSVTNQPAGSLSGARMVPMRMDSSGGSISLKGTQELFSDAKLIGAAGGPSAIGGSLSVSSGYVNPVTVTTVSAATVINLVVTQNGPTIPVPYQPGQSVVGKAVLDGQGNAVATLGHIAVSSFADGGFDLVNLHGNVSFSGPVAIKTNGSITVGDGGLIYADSTISLSAPYIVLGQPFQPPVSPLQPPIALYTESGTVIYPTPTYGPGSLQANGSLIDIGNLSLQGIGQANLIANNGDIRGDGTLDVQGAIYMRAGQIYPPTALTFTVNAYSYQSGSLILPGAVTIAGSGTRQLPLSAGGTLNIYAANINQGGVLRAPIGTINLGWDGSGTAPVDPVTNAAVPVSQNITLLAGSQTSVSAVDPVTGQSLIIPYGIYQNGTNWIDPTGTNITSGGGPSKSITISSPNVQVQSGALINLKGGGDLSAYNWVPGTGGTTDILASTSSFAILPGYQAAYAPYAPYASSSSFTSVNTVTGLNVTDPGYVNSNLKVGSQVYLGAGGGLPAGVYTLLPARYALLSGAFLVTPMGGGPVGSQTVLDGSTLVSGYLFHGMSLSQTAQPLTTRFDVASSAIVNALSQYQYVYASTVLAQGAAAAGNTNVRLPADGGQLVLNATQNMSIFGSVNAGAGLGGRGGLVDISTTSDILIAGPGASAGSGVTVLNSTVLSAFNAGSLLIGGVRQVGTTGDTVSVSTNNITVDNAGSPLSGTDIILVANNSLTLAAGAQISASGTLSAPADSLTLGNSSVSGSGNGTLLRVSSDPTAAISRVSVTTSTHPVMSVGNAVSISGTSIILDSTSGSNFAPTVLLSGRSIALDSGQISLQLNNAPPLQTNNGGLVLSGTALQSVESAQTLSLLSYSSIDIYGTGSIGSAASANIQLHASDIRGLMLPAGGSVTFTAQTILLDNSASAALPAPFASSSTLPASPVGTLAFNAGTLLLGANQLNVDRYATLALNASAGIVFQAATGGLAVQNAFTATTPSISGINGGTETITAGNALTVLPASVGTALAGGLGTNLTLTGSSVTVNSAISLPSGVLTIHATGGDVTVGGTLNAGGTAQSFFDLVKYTDAGQINLASDTGSVNVLAGSTINVAANPASGNAGTLSVSAPEGTFNVAAGTLFGKGGTGGQNGTFSLDVSTLGTSATSAGNTLSSLEQVLNAQLFSQPVPNAGYFTQSQNIRIRGDGGANNDVYINVTDPKTNAPVPVTARSFNLSADQGSIQVSGTIDASGATGGTIALEAHGSVTLLPGSTLTVVGANFNDAGQGGSVSLEAGATLNGVAPSTSATRDPVTGRFPAGTAVVDIQSGSTIQLGVLSLNGSYGAADPALVAAAAALGQFTGTLHLRAPQTASGTDVQVDPINGSIKNASSILIEGYAVIAPDPGGALDATVLGNIATNGTNFAGLAGSPATTGYARMLAILFGSDPQGLLPISNIVPGAEITGTGTLTLGTDGNDWDMSTLRFGPNSAPGFLTIRAAGNLIFQAALSDGFTADPNNPNPALYNDALMAFNPLLPANAQTWSYRLTAGADLSAADFQRVIPSTTTGSLQLGLSGVGPPSPGAIGSKALTGDAVAGHYQVIRTGSGDITISTGGSVQLLNQFATIYTAGTQVADATMGGAFSVPLEGGVSLSPSQEGTLGVPQEPVSYPAQYSYAGGNVTITSAGDIKHQTMLSGQLVDASEKQLPDNWLDRRGYLASNGQFGTTGLHDTGSTTWWVDFSNFFEGVGALGGGNVTLVARGNISNVDAVVPTNARIPDATPSASQIVELGGGDVTVRAGGNISGGVYYVESGQGTLSAGNQITTNFTRSPSLATSLANALPSQTWLPTTLFLGQGSFDVTAGGNVLLGPVVNPFLLPQGINNTFWYKTYFSTYAATDAVNVSSLAGSVTLREDTTPPGASQSIPILEEWLQNVSLLSSNPQSVSYSQPWLRLDENNVLPFSTVLTLLPPTLRVTAFSGDINLVGSITLSPSPQGTAELAAAGSINGLQSDGVTPSSASPTPVTAWTSSTINLSDANPASIPGVANPLAYQSLVGTRTGSANNSSNLQTLILSLNNLFAETGATQGAASVLQIQQALHAPGILHADDTTPAYFYAETGDISGLTLYSAKAARVLAGNDLTDISLYIQNTSADSVSLIGAGGNIIPYDPNSPLQLAASQAGNFTNARLSNSGTGFQAGDLQISGPGTLEVFAGQNLELGLGPAIGNGTGVGISSIGNSRNPYLPYAGANLIVGAGMGSATGLSGSQFDFSAFIAQFLNPATGGVEAARYLPSLATMLDMDGASNAAVWAAFSQLPAEQQDSKALDIFYLALRDAGRDHNDPTSAGYGNYAGGYRAIAALFPGNQWSGSISLDSRNIETTNGGDINILAPGGSLSLGTLVLTPPPGIVTQQGGNISIFTNGDVNVGTERIFTLLGGNEIIWSTNGSIAAGNSSKTVQSAPPTRVLIDPSSGNVKTDLAGLATGGGIGVLASVAGVAAANVDLIAPTGTIDAGDAGIRATGKLNVAAVAILNASNIQASAGSTGTPAVAAAPVVTVSVAPPPPQNNNAATEAQQQAQKEQTNQPVADNPSLWTVTVEGYGGD